MGSPDRLDLLAVWTLAQPVLQVVWAPVLLQRIQTVMDEQPTAVIQVSPAHLLLDSFHQVIRVHLRMIQSQAPQAFCRDRHSLFLRGRALGARGDKQATL